MRHHQIITITLATIMFLPTANNSVAQREQGRGGLGIIGRFSDLDTDNNGLITDQELTAWQESAFLVMDANEDGILTRAEYMAEHLHRGADPVMRGPKYDLRQAEKERRFSEMDPEDTGAITKENFKNICQINFIDADKNMDGALSKEEFRIARMMGRPRLLEKQAQNPGYD